MADWKDKYLQGSFRGVEFKTLSHEKKGGRRKVIHEFPQRDVSRSEDMGKKIGEFSLDLYVLGDDYFAQRDALMEALDAEGSGELIHPYLGHLIVQSGEYTLSETTDEGRIGRFRTNFSEAGKTKFPQPDIDATQLTLDNAAAVQENSKSFFENAFSVANSAAHVIEAASNDLNTLADQLEGAVKKITEPVANLTFAISNFKADISALAKLPGELADRIEGMFTSLVDEFTDDPKTAQKVLGVFVGNLSSAFVPTVTNTASSQKINGNQQAIINLGEQQSLSHESSTAVESDYVSAQESINVRDKIFGNLDLHLEKDGLDDDLFQSIKDLQSSIAKALPPSNLGELISFTPKATEPAIVIAHKLFQDLDKEQEIIDQNNIEHPGFVEGGQSIEVSSG